MIGGEHFRFNKQDHSYWLGANRLFSVTEVIQLSGLKDLTRIDPGVLEHASQRGTAVHASCHFYDQNDLDWETVSDEIKPYVLAWEAFTKDLPLEWADMEKPIYHATFGFAGTPDRVTETPYRGIFDIKTYRPDAATGVQLAGYSFLRFGQQSVYNTPKRFGVWLKDDGKYSLTEYTDRGDEAVFMACLTVAKFKRSQK